MTCSFLLGCASPLAKGRNSSELFPLSRDLGSEGNEMDRVLGRNAWWQESTTLAFEVPPSLQTALIERPELREMKEKTNE